MRRFYGDRRVKGAFVRKGWLEWARAGFPREANGLPNAKYLNRGKDDFIKLEWDEAFELVARAQIDIARTYSGPEGAALLQQQNYDPAMIETMHEAGTRELKFRGGMPFLGATRIMGLVRYANMMGLLDDQLRNVGSDKALGGRGWDSYSWHTDLPPGHPMVTGANPARRPDRGKGSANRRATPGRRPTGALGRGCGSWACSARNAANANAARRKVRSVDAYRRAAHPHRQPATA